MAMGFVSPPDTLFAGIQKLPPGHRMVLDELGLKITRYWDVFQDVEPVEGLSEKEYVDHTLELLEEAVRIRLVADVPVGVFLSGGIDSSLVAALAARNSSHPVQSFTLGFRDHPEYNEMEYARGVAKFLKADAHEIMIGPEEIRAFFPLFLKFQEEPVMNPIWFAMYFVSKLARDNGVIVVLSGDGGDELYAGYNRWMDYLRLYEGGAYRLLRATPGPLRSLAGGVGQALLRKENQREVLRRAASGQELFWGGTTFKTSQLAEMLAKDIFSGDDLWSRLPLEQLQQDFRLSLGRNPETPLAWMSYATLKGNLLEDFLMRLDKMGMAASVEGRVPLLDHEFIRWSQSIPASKKYPGYRNKHLLREAAYRLIPRELIDRPKMGFCAPVESWLAEAFGAQLGDSLRLLQERERVFNPAWFRTFSDNAAKPGGLGFAGAHWSLLMLGQWYTQWISN
jgi:asparagine synthase (glutamine-hydrolysing)